MMLTPIQETLVRAARQVVAFKHWYIAHEDEFDADGRMWFAAYFMAIAQYTAIIGHCDAILHFEGCRAADHTVVQPPHQPHWNDIQAGRQCLVCGFIQRRKDYE